MTPTTDARGDGVRELIDLMDVLRSPGGCPWDAEQTHESLLEYLLEESYETVDAVHSGDRSALREELGDVLLQVVFHARIAQEHDTDAFDVDDVARGITAKLRRRHPHVFAGEAAPAPGEAQARWEELKAAEKQRASVTDGVPDSMPASLLAVKLLGRAGRKVETSAVTAVDDSVVTSAAKSALAAVVAHAQTSMVTHDESGAVTSANVEPAQFARVESPEVTGISVDDAVGKLLLAIIAEAAASGVDTEKALRDAVRRFRFRLRAAEGLPD